MKMNRTFRYPLLLGAILLVACQPRTYEVAKVEARRIAIDSTWDSAPDAEAVALLAPYKMRIDSMMNHPVGTSAMPMDKYRPESPLSNLIADVLRQAGTSVQDAPADMGLINIGGIRNSLDEGTITTGTVFEILPFENSLCVLTLKGSSMKLLMENIAQRRGEGVSGIKMVITADGQLLEATVGGEPIDDNRIYTVATVDYLAEGNDGMTALLQALKRQCPDGVTLRSLFMHYVERQTAEGKSISAKLENRITSK